METFKLINCDQLKQLKQATANIVHLMFVKNMPRVFQDDWKYMWTIRLWIINCVQTDGERIIGDRQMVNK